MTLERQAMTPDAPHAGADGPPETAAASTAELTPQRLRLQHLFRHTLKAGEVNPLLLIVPLYRQEAEA
jgi:hypothetical protein